MNWASYSDGFASLFEQGGLVLWTILAASFYLWILLAERYYFHWQQIPDLREKLRTEWRQQPRALSRPLTIRRIDALVDALRTQANRNIIALRVLVSILPMLGLLGTVSGMIKVFEVITVFGTGNTRGMAFGISEALVTTMAGLFTALSGLYFVTDLERRAEHVSRKFRAELVNEQ